jgi:hypothetical protein
VVIETRPAMQDDKREALSTLHDEQAGITDVYVPAL